MIEKKQYELLATDFKDLPAIDPDNSLVNQSNEADIFLEDISILRVVYNRESEARFSTIKNGVSGSIKSATFLSMLLSISSAVALVKIFQMFDFFVYFTVDLPTNY